MAKIDPLTGLYNRNSIEEFAQLFIDEAQRYQTSFSVIMVDLDDFKHINDVYGHPVGDEVLKKLSVIFRVLWHKGTKRDTVLRNSLKSL